MWPYSQELEELQPSCQSFELFCPNSDYNRSILPSLLLLSEKLRLYYLFSLFKRGFEYYFKDRPKIWLRIRTTQLSGRHNRHKCIVSGIYDYNHI
ncbi:hypothetical protein DTO164E3_6168 [Paecilomyces variotii]|nr:hypothetical protein DTO164E3_6168 [Paecilomyces variotii]KAJ9205166.1 hypothetical protein DTO032I3_2369 [Paecilomyces variotii]KAJ9280320.1 hypothetical protein DTO021D3_2908 [Paecilomyces variotii]KAJ9343134.1 hypothetical protein DTO027B6_4409 [Paecilomyces variotii]KAJ9359661.1 hypothetical protein DTO027B9_1709 [Paecilomyces variotii]